MIHLTWSIKRSSLGHCLHRTPFMFDDSEQQQISHLSQQIIVRPRAFRHRRHHQRVTSGRRRRHPEQRDTSWEYTPKNATLGVTHRMECPERFTLRLSWAPYLKYQVRLSHSECFFFFSTFGEFRQETSECSKKSFSVGFIQPSCGRWPG